MVGDTNATARRREAVGEAIALLHAQVPWLESVANSAAASDDSQPVIAWQICVTLVQADLGIGLQGMNEASTRGMRVLNRCALEQAMRLHYYAKNPGQAKSDGENIIHVMRNIMRPAVNIQGDMTDEQYRDFRQFMNAQREPVAFGTYHPMLRATLRGLRVPSVIYKRAYKWLEMEYTVASGFVHGSHAAMLDVFRRLEGREGAAEVCQESQFLSLNVELERFVACAFLSLIAIERYHNVDRGGMMHFRTAQLQCEYDWSRRVGYYTKDTSWELISRYYGLMNPLAS